ncbi:MAG: response regulator [Cytophagaceae bacterium]|nr:response regulator [Cytophagaceae bacterium]|tara:strand:- start:79 stop:486 length:408 start_codon:yes stop_codon:yes gene_type:complete
MKKIDIACIIDDDPVFVFGAQRMMEITSFCKSIMVFPNGQEAINALEPLMTSNSDNIPDVILLDLNMPIMDGWSFLDAFLEIPSEKNVTIYIITSSIDPADTEKAKLYEGNLRNYLIKPISKAKLESILTDMQNI